MPQARGSQSALAVFDETVFGADPAGPSGVLFRYKSNSLASSQNLIKSETLGGGRERTVPGLGNIDAAGDIVSEFSAENDGTFLRHAIGSLVTTGAGPYVHTLNLGDLPVGMVLEKDFGANIAGVGRYEKFNGGRIASASFKFPSEGQIEASYSIKAATSTLASAPLDASLTDNGHTPFTAFQASIEEGGVAIATVTEAEIKIDNELDDSVFVIGGAGVRKSLGEGFASVSGSITTIFDSAALLTKAINGTQSSLKITLSRGNGLGTAGNESVEFLVNQLQYQRTSPTIDGPGGVLASFIFEGFRDGATGGLTVTVKNALATI